MNRLKSYICGVLAAALLAAIGTVASAQDKQLTVGYMKHPIQEASLAMIEKWGAANGVKIIKVPMAYNVFLEKVTATLTSSGDQFDLVWVNDDWGQLWAKNLEPLSELKGLADIDMEPIEAAYLNADKQPTAVPMGHTVGVMMYRTDLVKPDEVPDTWDKLVEVSQRLQKEGKAKWGFVGGMQMNHTWYTFFWSAWTNSCDVFEPPYERRGDVLKKSGYKNMMKAPCQRELAEFWWDNIHQRKISPPGMAAYTRDDANAIFKAGDAAFTIAISSLLGEFNNPKLSKAAGKVGMTAFPRGPRNTKHAAWNDIWAWSIPKGAPAERKALAKQALDAMLFDMDGQLEMWKTTGAVPPSKKAWKLIGDKDKDFQTLQRIVFEQELVTHGAYYFEDWPAVHRAYSNALVSAMIGKREDIPGHLDEGAQKIDAIIKDYLAK